MLVTSTDVVLPRLHALANDVVLAAWDWPEATPLGRLSPFADGAAPLRPYAAFTVPTSWGGQRVVIALRWRRGGALAFRDESGRTLAALDAAARPAALDPPLLFGGLGAGAQVRLIKFLLETCRSSFGLRDHPGFAAHCRRCVAELGPTPPALVARVAATAALDLFEGALPAGFGPVVSVVLLGRGTVRQGPFLPHLGTAGRDGRQPLRLVAEAEAGDIALIFGQAALACRRLDRGGGGASLLAWLEGGKAPLAVREYVAGCLAKRAPADAEAAAVLAEMQLLAPLPRRSIANAAKPLGGEIGLAVSHGAGGLFVSGWLYDPHAMIRRIHAVSALGATRLLTTPLHRFPRVDVAEHYADRAVEAGFATHLPGAAEPVPVRQHRFELELHSGTRLALTAPLAPLGLAEARNAVLASLPPSHLTAAALKSCIGPAAASLHAAYMATRREPDTIGFGRPPARPAVSLVIPLYRNLDFLRFQIAAFAVDATLAEVEIIYVLDSPEQRKEVEHLLLGLHALHGLALTLAVMPDNYGFSAASNAGGRLARGGAILFLNSDVVPDRPGWLVALLAELADPKVGAVGPKLLFEDDSLQHAGMYFGTDLRGDWINLHYHKGLPRDYAPANLARSVPGVTGAALLMPRRLFEQTGGFSEDYIIGDYEDSDLCLKIRAAGYDIRYQPAAELYHLERQSIRRHDGYMRGIACAYNRSLHAARWAGAMAALMADLPPAAAEPPPAPTAPARPVRRRSRR